MRYESSFVQYNLRCRFDGNRIVFSVRVWHYLNFGGEIYELEAIGPIFVSCAINVFIYKPQLVVEGDRNKRRWENV